MIDCGVDWVASEARNKNNGGRVSDYLRYNFRRRNCLSRLAPRIEQLATTGNGTTTPEAKLDYGHEVKE
jgi:hypothetical protein